MNSGYTEMQEGDTSTFFKNQVLLTSYRLRQALLTVQISDGSKRGGEIPPNPKQIDR